MWSLPQAAEEQSANRVERWARLGEFRTTDGPAVRGWSAREEAQKPSIPITAFLDVAQPRPSALGPAAPIGSETAPVALSDPPGTTYRTVCVRLCDGAYFPLSFATTAEHLESDEQICAAGCDSASKLYFYKNPGEGTENLVDRAGQPYSSLPTAFQFRSHYNAQCACKPQPWQQLARERHRMYALETSGHSDEGRRTAEVEKEIVTIRERLAARRQPAPVSQRPPIYAAAAPAVVSDASASATPAIVDVAAVATPPATTVTATVPPVAVLAPEPSAIEPAVSAPDPGIEFEAGSDAEATETSEPTSDPVLEVEPGKKKVTDGQNSKAAAKSKRETRQAARTAPRQRPRIIASRPAPVRYFLVRRWASRTPADEFRRNLLRGSF